MISSNLYYCFLVFSLRYFKPTQTPLPSWSHNTMIPIFKKNIPRKWLSITIVLRTHQYSFSSLPDSTTELPAPYLLYFSCSVDWPLSKLTNLKQLEEWNWIDILTWQVPSEQAWVPPDKTATVIRQSKYRGFTVIIPMPAIRLRNSAHRQREC